jgi:acyl-CoA reductase-like NAD-dependent aldehyde dehydrogenase
VLLSPSSILLSTEVVEHATGMGTLMMGETLQSVSNNVDTYSYLEPLGVCAGVCPFNFPAMIPLWVRLSYPLKSIPQ